MSQVRELLMGKHELSLEMIKNLGIGIDIIEVSRFRKKSMKKTRISIKKSLLNQKLIIA